MNFMASSRLYSRFVFLGALAVNCYFSFVLFETGSS